MMPFLIPCNSSPAPAIISSRKKSTIERTVVSLWPTPTVSTRITSKPAASQTRMVSRLLRATPPRVPPEGEGRMKARRSRDSNSIRVLSPRMLPRVTVLLGSTASTATLWPCAHRCRPSASIKVLLPPPGTPVMPTRIELPVWGNSCRSTSWPMSKCAWALLSTRVMACPRTLRSPASTPATYSSIVSCRRRGLFFTRHRYARLTGNAVVTAIDAGHDRSGEFLAGVFGDPVGFVVFFSHGNGL